MIIADLDRALRAAVAALVADGTMSATVAGAATAGAATVAGAATAGAATAGAATAGVATAADADTAGEAETAGGWRAHPDGDPASFASSLAFGLAAPHGRDPAVVAASLAPHLRQLPWVVRAAPSGDGYLTITVTLQALAESAARQAVAGNAAAESTILRGSAATIGPWPDLAAAPSWRRAWQDHTAAVTNRMARAAGAHVSVTTITTRERASASPAAARAPRPTAPAVAWFGVSSVRYWLARTQPRQVAHLGRQLRPGSRPPEPFYQVRHAHAHAASTLRWAAELSLDAPDPDARAGELLDTAAERKLLGLLPWLPFRVASAARRNRPDVLPMYLEEVAAAWLACWQAAPALPFGGRAAPREVATTGARLLLAHAVRTVLAAGLTLTGAEDCAGAQGARLNQPGNG